MTGFVFLDKPDGITSFFACAKIRKIFGIKKVGHTGTLDPMATGALVVAVGQAARFIELIPSHDKAYLASFTLGVTTDTLDITGKILTKNEVTVKKSDVEKALESFVGEIEQLPPMYSAIKKDGVRLYDLARQGIEIEREKRKVKIHSLKLVSFDESNSRGVIECECSSGTYIRSLIFDIGEALGCGAVMTKLRRTKSNGIKIEDCFTISQLEFFKEENTLNKALRSIDELVNYPKITVTPAQSIRFQNGGALDLKRLHFEKKVGLYDVYSPSGEFLGVGEIDENFTELSCRKVCNEQ